MEIATLWIKRRDFEDGPAELIVAWDEYSIEENFAGWRGACDRELKLIGDDVAAFRYLGLTIPDAEVERYFAQAKVSVEKLVEIDDPRTL